jgi:rSAM/selenodomain-associated transferase 2
MKVSIIIPVLNEEKGIKVLLDYLLGIIDAHFTKEIIIVDGGSTDATLQILSKYKSLKILTSEKGRAKQMNFGARNATSQILYFLHADTFPPKHFDAAIVKKVQDGKLSGCFKMKFDYYHPVLKVSEWFTQFNFKSCRGGDQSLFVSRDLFEKLGGFNDHLEIYEDNEFIFRLYEHSKFTVIQKPVTTSARKYKKNGVWKLQFHFFMIHVKFWLGSHPDTILFYYQKNVKT